MAQAAFIYPLPHTATLRVALPMVAGQRGPADGAAPAPGGERAPAYPAVDPVARPGGPRVGGPLRRVACGSCCPMRGCRRRSRPTAGSCCSSTTAPRSRPGRARTTASGSVTPLSCSPRSTATASTRRRPRCLRRTRAGSGSTGSSSASRASGTPTAAPCGRWPSTGGSRAIASCSTRCSAPSPKGRTGSTANAASRRRRGAGAVRTVARRGVGRAPRSVRLLLLGRLLGRCRPALGRGVAGRGRTRPRRPPTRDRSADSFWADVKASLGMVANRLGTDAIPAGPRRRLDAGVIGSLVACEPLKLLAADDPRSAPPPMSYATDSCLGDAFFQAISHTGLGTYLTMQVAAVELAAGDRRALDRLQWLLAAATPTWTWPEAIHPRLPAGAWATATTGGPPPTSCRSYATCSCARCRPSGVSGTPRLALCSMVPDDWLGHGHRGARRAHPLRATVVRRALAR